MQNVVIFGASNVTLSLPLIWTSLSSNSREPVRLIVMAGHGRSFGKPSTVLGRRLPGILPCGGWDALRRLVPHDEPLKVLITDIGNDIVYGVPTAELTGWVREVLDRLQAWRPSLVMTGLPLCSLRTLSAARFRFFRTLFFPSSKVLFEDTQRIAHEVHSHVLQLATEYSAELIEPQAEWYGIDPIHIRRRHRRVVWQQLLKPFVDRPTCRPLSSAECLRIWQLKPEQLWRGQRLIETAQPAERQNESELWLF